MKTLREILSIGLKLGGKKEVVLIGEQHKNLEHISKEVAALEKYKPRYLLWEGYNYNKIEGYDKLLYDKAAEYGVKIINPDIPFNGTPFLNELNELSNSHYTESEKEEERINKSKYYLEKFDSWREAIKTKREDYMFNNIKKYIEENRYNDSPIIVVTGSNHLNGLSERLDNSGIRYKRINLNKEQYKIKEYSKVSSKY